MQSIIGKKRKFKKRRVFASGVDAIWIAHLVDNAILL